MVFTGQLLLKSGQLTPAGPTVAPLPSGHLVAFTDCLDGPGQTVGEGCARFDYDRDGDVDLADFGRLQLTRR